MPKSLSKCLKCGTYTMKEGPCRACDSKEAVRLVYPPRFSPDEKYGSYRREMKKKIQEQLDSQQPRPSTSGPATPPS